MPELVSLTESVFIIFMFISELKSDILFFRGGKEDLRPISPMHRRYSFKESLEIQQDKSLAAANFTCPKLKQYLK